MTRLEIMETVPPGGNSGNSNKDSKGVTAVADRPNNQPSVITTPAEKSRETALQKLFGPILRIREGSGVQVLVKPDESRPRNTIYVADASGNVTGVVNVGPDNQGPGGPDGVDNGGRGGGGGRWENPRGPNDPDWLWSPEFKEKGRNIAIQIFERESWDYEVKYNDVNGPILDKLYVDWQDWVAQNEERAFRRIPFDRRDYLTQQTEETPPPAKEVRVIEPQDLDGLSPISVLFTKYNDLRDNPSSTDAEITEVEGQLSKYFLEARRLGLLSGIDRGLRLLYVDIMRGVYPDDINRKLSEPEIWAKIDETRQAILSLGKTSFQARRRANRAGAYELAPLDGVWEAYVNLTIDDRFSLLLNGEGLTSAPTIDGEFAFGGESLAELNQFASSDEQIRALLPRDPELRVQATIDGELDEEELARLVNNRERTVSKAIRDRQEAIGRYGQDRERFRQMAERRELYWQPTYANYFEVTAQTQPQFETAVETFTSWIRSGLTKSPNELFQRVSGFKDALTTAAVRAGVDVSELRRELEGMIGVLGADHANEHYNADYFKQFMEFAAQDEGPERFVRLGRANRGKVGAVLWKYDNDPRFELYYSPHGSRGQLSFERDPLAQEQLQDVTKDLLILEVMATEIKGYNPDDSEKVLIHQATEENLAEVVNFHSDEEFKNLFDGFDQKAQDDFFDQFSPHYPEFVRAKEIATAFRKGIVIFPLTEADQEIYEKMQNGQIVQLKPAEEKYIKRLMIVRRMQQEYKAGRFDPSKLKDDELRMYEEAKNAVDLASELYGVMGEKAKRGGGVFLVERKNTDGTVMKDSLDRPVVDYIPNTWAEKYVQFAENWVKATYGGELDVETQAKVGGRKGIPADELKYRVDQARRMAIWSLKTYGYEAKLWDFTLLRDGKPADLNFAYVKDLFGNPYGINNSSTANEVERYRYCVPENPRVLGYNSAGKEVILVFDQNGKPITGEATGLEFDDDGNAVIYDLSKTSTDIKRFNEKKGEHGEEEIVKRERVRIKFDNLNRNAEARSMELKIPGSTGKKRVDFKTAVNHLYAGWTGHPYWGYQEEDTGLILRGLEGAKRIRDGQSRPEDEKPHAQFRVQLDPTLQRVDFFHYREDIEDLITLAAVEESYQGHYRIQDELYQNFYSEDADRQYNHIAYNLQDWGGSTKMWLNHRAIYARWTDMLGRRSRTMLPVLPLHFDSMSEVWGARGKALDTLRMMNYGRSSGSSYRMVGQFALEKWIGQAGAAQDQFEALFGYASPQEKRDIEGYTEKPTNDADVTLQDYRPHVGFLLNPHETQHEDAEIKFLADVRKSRGRKETVIQRMRVLETGKRGERAPLWLEGIDIWVRNPDGSIKIEDGRKEFNWSVSKMRDVGSSRHSGTRWFWQDTVWTRSDKPGEGQDLYKNVALYYKLMDFPQIADNRLAEEAKKEGRSHNRESRWSQELGKEVR